MVNIRSIRNKSIGIIKKIFTKLNSLKLRKYYSFKKPENIHPSIAKYHKIFEGNREKSKGLQSINSSPLKRKLHFPKNSYLVEVFKEDTHSNPQEESEIIASPAKRTKYCRSGGGGDILVD